MWWHFSSQSPFVYPKEMQSIACGVSQNNKQQVHQSSNTPIITTWQFWLIKASVLWKDYDNNSFIQLS